MSLFNRQYNDKTLQFELHLCGLKNENHFLLRVSVDVTLRVQLREPSRVSSLDIANEAETSAVVFPRDHRPHSRLHSSQINVCLQVGPEQVEFMLVPEKSLKVTSFCL